MWGLLLPKVRRQFAEFLQDTSLKRLGILYLTTCVGFGYGLYSGAISWNHFAALTNPIRKNNLRDPSHTTRPTNINVVPIDYPLRARLRGRLTLLRLALSRNPWSFGGRVSHPPIATHVCIRTSDTSTTHYQIASSAYGTLRYRMQ